MTFDEYDKTEWTAHMKAEYNGHTYDIEGANFPEYLVCIDDGSGDGMWVRCENITLVN